MNDAPFNQRGGLGNLPAPEIIAQEIADDLEAAREQSATIADHLKK
jgi:hypothetical protein